MTEERDEEKPEHPMLGVAYGLGAYLWWGAVMPIYMKTVSHINLWELLGHRAFWSVFFLAILMGVFGAYKSLWKSLQSPRTLALLLGSTIFILGNWFGFLYAIYDDHLQDASLGYYINPLISVLLGFVFLGERLRKPQVIALILAAIGVSVQIFGLGRVPWISLFLATCFGSYGLLRKLAPVKAVPGLFFESMLLMVLIMPLVAYIGRSEPLAIISGSWQTKALLPFAGVVTFVPLLFFNGAAQRVKLATLGFMQYITPTMQLATAVFLFGEPFSKMHLLSFIMIWMALAIYTTDMIRHRHDKE